MRNLAPLTFEIGAIRPPSEGGSNSLLIRVTRNCPWNRCKFCFGTFYNREKFQLRSIEEIKENIHTIKIISDEIKHVSWQIGHAGNINNQVAAAIIQNEPDLCEHNSFITVFNWLGSGGRTVFLQDADSLIMPTQDLIEVIKSLKETFPTINRITSYARAKTIYRKTLDELKDLGKAGLNRIHVGLETGDNELLTLVDKGVTAEEHIAAGRKIKEAGIELSEYIMPGLGGRALSNQHALNTARTLTAINPHYIRIRPFRPLKNTPMHNDYVEGKIELCSPYELLQELQKIIQDLDVTSHLCFDHMSNYWLNISGGILFKHSYEGYQFPVKKDTVLTLIKEGLSVEESIQQEAYEVTLGNI